jgi:hypothetical protein
MSEQGDSTETTAAGAGLSDEEMARQVAEQTPSEERYADVSKLEADGALTDKEIAKADADDLDGK